MNSSQRNSMSSDEYMEGYFGTNNDRHLSQISIKNASTDGGDISDEGTLYKHVRSGIFSLPGTPERRMPRTAAWDKEYDSDAEVRGRRSRVKGRQRLLDRAWEIRRSREADGECRVLVRQPGQNWSMRMDMDEVKACRDLGIELPSDWTVEILYADTSCGGDSPVNSWRISSPGDDPKDVKARLRTWAQAVAFASASRLGV